MTVHGKGNKVSVLCYRGEYRTCSRCGQINGNLKDEQVLKCSICGLRIDRDFNACINKLKLGMALCGSGSRLPKVEDLANQISEVNLALIS